MVDKKEEFRTRLMVILRRVPCMGVACAILSSVALATGSLTVVYVKEVDPVFLVVCRAFIQFLAYLPLAIYFGDPILSFGVAGERIALVLRGICGFTSSAGKYESLHYLTISDSQSIVFASPAFTSIFGCVLLGEPCGIFQAIIIAVTLTGVVLIARPAAIFGPTPDDVIVEFTQQDRIVGVTFAIVACIAMSSSYITLRKLQKTPTTLTVTWFSLIITILGTILLLFMHFLSPIDVVLPKNTYQWSLAIANGLCGVIGQGLLTVSLKIENAGIISLCRTFDIVMAFVYQILVLKEPVLLTSIIGAIVVSSGCVAVAAQKLWATKKQVPEK